MVRMKYLFSIFFFSAALFGQNGKDFSLDSQQKARRVLDDSIRVFGGVEAVNQARNFSLKITGTSW